MMRRYSLALWTMLLPAALLVRAQDDSRAKQIATGAEQKEHTLKPEHTPILERYVGGVIDGLSVGRGGFNYYGLGLRFGGLVETAGFGLGPQYRARDLLGGQLNIRTSLVGTTKGWYAGDFEADLPALWSGKAFANLYVVTYNLASMPYYGPGPSSRKAGRSNYREEDTAIEIRPGIRPIRHLKFGLIGGLRMVNTGAGGDSRYASTETVYPASVTPGIDRQSSFWESGAFVHFDYRNSERYPVRGGSYRAEYVGFSERDLGQFSFNRFEADLAQYVPFFQEKHVLALRGRTVLATPRRGNVVPFYLQPTLGGGSSLRGFRAFRFYDDNALLLNAEYRWELFSLVDMALFADAGKVSPRRSQLNFHDLESSFGFGYRVKARGNTVARLDIGFSHEGFQLWLKYNEPFSATAWRSY